ncbi:MAG: hypothetical protein ABI418_03410, partial [Jatrophihabitantaceae bacterium]
MGRAADDDGESVRFSVTDGLEPATDPVAGPGPAGLPGLLKVALSLIGALALVALLSVQQARRHPSSAVRRPVPTTAAPASSPVPAPPSTPTVVQAGRPLLDVPAGWQLFGRGPTAVVRIELAAGRVTTTPVPGLASSGPVSFVVGADRAIVRPLDFVPGYVVLDGRATQELTGPAMKAGPVLPGPDPQHVWTPSADNSGLRLSSLGGEQGTAFLPAEPVIAFPDQAGYAAFQAVGGVYDAGPHGVHRITAGVLVATGPTRWLTYDCDDSDACQLTVTDRASGAKWALRAPIRPEDSRGLISADGRTAALIVSTQSGWRLRLLDLRSGTVRPVAVQLSDEVADSA